MSNFSPCNPRTWAAAIFFVVGLSAGVVSAESVCDFDGDHLSELVVVQPKPGGFTWLAVNPRTGKKSTIVANFGVRSSRLIPGNWLEPNEAVAAIVQPPGPGASAQAIWLATYAENGEWETYSRKLGRRGDLIILGGDYDGNGITDSLILKQTTGKLGLRVNFFLSSYNASNLGKERLYRRLGAPFRDKNFFYSPDGGNDFLGVLRAGSSGRILSLRPFTDTPRRLSVGALPAGAQGPLSIKQAKGQPDLLAFYLPNESRTHVILKDLLGRTAKTTEVPATGTVMVGDYLEDAPGWEIAIGKRASAVILNPVTGAQISLDVPSGNFVSCVGNQRID